MSEPTLAELEKAAKDAADKVEKFQDSVAQQSGEYVKKLTKKQEQELAKLRREADEAEAKLEEAQKAAQAAPVPQDEATNPLSPRNLFWFGLFLLIAVATVVGVVVLRNILDRESSTPETQQAAGDKNAHVTPELAGMWIDISKDFPGRSETAPRTTTDINDPGLAFIRRLLEARHFEATVMRGYFRTQADPENPEITEVGYGLTVFLFGQPDDTKVFYGDYTQYWMGRGYSQAGSYAGDGAILQSPDHVDVSWRVRNAVIRINAGGSTKYPQEAAKKDAVSVADLVAERACHGCAG